VEALGGLGADMNLASSTGQTPLGAACARGNTEAAAAVERLGGRKGSVVPDGRASEGITRG
jgi:ankyrin repeat protein